MILKGEDILFALEHIGQRGFGITAFEQGRQISIREKTREYGQVLGKRKPISRNDFQTGEARTNLKSGVLDGKNGVHMLSPL